MQFLNTTSVKLLKTCAEKGYAVDNGPIGAYLLRKGYVERRYLSPVGKLTAEQLGAKDWGPQMTVYPVLVLTNQGKWYLEKLKAKT